MWYSECSHLISCTRTYNFEVFAINWWLASRATEKSNAWQRKIWIDTEAYTHRYIYEKTSAATNAISDLGPAPVISHETTSLSWGRKRREQARSTENREHMYVASEDGESIQKKAFPVGTKCFLISGVKTTQFVQCPFYYTISSSAMMSSYFNLIHRWTNDGKLSTLFAR